MESLHELFDVAQKVDDMVSFNEGGEPQIIGENGEIVTVDENNQTMIDFLLGVHTLTDMIQTM